MAARRPNPGWSAARNAARRRPGRRQCLSAVLLRALQDDRPRAAGPPSPIAFPRPSRSPTSQRGRTDQCGRPGATHHRDTVRSGSAGNAEMLQGHPTQGVDGQGVAAHHRFEALPNPVAAQRGGSVSPAPAPTRRSRGQARRRAPAPVRRDTMHHTRRARADVSAEQELRRRSDARRPHRDARASSSSPLTNTSAPTRSATS